MLVWTMLILGYRAQAGYARAGEAVGGALVDNASRCCSR
jgi:hypothetical protein